MKFGIFYEHQLPKPWNQGDEQRLFQEALDQVELADKLGFDYAWEVEHHFLEEYSHSSAPEVFLAAASQRTKNIRLGHGIIQLTTNHPARVAERVSTLDLISGGRVEMGIGEGSSVTELHPFDRRFRDKRAVWEDAVRCLIPMFTEHNWEYHGEYFDLPARNVLPKPQQKPHPPLVFGGSAPGMLRRIGRHGDGWIGSAGKGDTLGKLCDKIDEEARAAGRDPASIEKTVMWPYAAEGPDAVKRYEDLGIARLVIPWLALGGENPLAAMEEVGNKLIAKA